MSEAVCILNDGKKIHGVVTFIPKQLGKQNGLLINVEMKGLKPGLHGFHIHEFGDMRDGCTSMGGHFNPLGKNHGGRDSAERHMGDFGNVVADRKGMVKESFFMPGLKLNGKNSIVGRGLVVHADEDDLGLGGHADSLTTGHSGARIVCGIIGLGGGASKK